MTPRQILLSGVISRPARNLGRRLAVNSFTVELFIQYNTRGPKVNGGVTTCMRHARSSTLLDRYAQTNMDELIAAQELMLDAIYSHAGGAVQ